MPDVNGGINAVAADGTGGWFIGGTFTVVGDVSRNRLAHILGDGTVDPDWDPNANGSVLALAVLGGDVYVGGQFDNAGRARPETAWRRSPLPATAPPIPTWNPNPNNTVLALAVVGGDVYAGGTFTTLNGATRPATGWRRSPPPATAPSTPPGTPTPTRPSSALAVAGGDLYAGGQFSNGGRRDRAKPAGEDRHYRRRRRRRRLESQLQQHRHRARGRGRRRLRRRAFTTVNGATRPQPAGEDRHCRHRRGRSPTGTPTQTAASAHWRSQAATSTPVGSSRR